MKKSESLEAFLDRVCPEPNTGCWLWTGCLTQHGYGKSDRFLAHRLSWMLHIGTIPDGISVCHRCDTPPCVNPGHLFLGTHQDNMTDMARKGRAGGFRKIDISGENHYSHKVTWEIVREIRALASSGLNSFQIVKSYPYISSRTVRDIVSGHTWKAA